MALIYSVEDDLDISKIINKTLSKAGYQVESFYNGESFLDAFNKQKPQMVLLDMMLPDTSGLDLLKRIREVSNDIYVLILSAKRMITDKVDGFDLGADDYIEKPFDLLELISRVNAHFRRIKYSDVLTYNGLILDTNAHSVKYNGQVINLTVKEFAILEILLKKKGEVITREALLETIWGSDAILESRTVDMHIKSIRKKLGNDDLILTVYGLGYKLV